MTGSAGSTRRGRSFGADPLGRFVVTGQGEFEGTPQATAASGVQGLLSLGSSLLFAADGCGGGSTPAPTAQKSSVVTPSGTSTLVNTPTATNASGKALQIPLIQQTLTVN